MASSIRKWIAKEFGWRGTIIDYRRDCRKIKFNPRECFSRSARYWKSFTTWEMGSSWIVQRKPLVPNYRMHIFILSSASVSISRSYCNGRWKMDIDYTTTRKRQWVDKDKPAEPSPKARLIRKKSCCVFGRLNPVSAPTNSHNRIKL